MNNSTKEEWRWQVKTAIKMKFQSFSMFLLSLNNLIFLLTNGCFKDSFHCFWCAWFNIQWLIIVVILVNNNCLLVTGITVYLFLFLCLIAIEVWYPFYIQLQNYCVNNWCFGFIVFRTTKVFKRWVWRTHASESSSSSIAFNIAFAIPN